MREVIPGVAAGAVILTDRSPLPLGKIGTPAPPGHAAIPALGEAPMLGRCLHDASSDEDRRPPTRDAAGRQCRLAAVYAHRRARHAGRLSKSTANWPRLAASTASGARPRAGSDRCAAPWADLFAVAAGARLSPTARTPDWLSHSRVFVWGLPRSASGRRRSSAALLGARVPLPGPSPAERSSVCWSDLERSSVPMPATSAQPMNCGSTSRPIAPHQVAHRRPCPFLPSVMTRVPGAERHGLACSVAKTSHRIPIAIQSSRHSESSYHGTPGSGGGRVEHYALTLVSRVQVARRPRGGRWGVRPTGTPALRLTLGRYGMA